MIAGQPIHASISQLHPSHPCKAKLGEKTHTVFVFYFQDLKEGGILDNTIVLFAADHSANGQAGDFFRTFVGQYEEHLPVAYILLPDSFKKKYPAVTEDLKFNAQYRLTSHMDLHQTGLAIVKKTYVEPSAHTKLDVNSPGSSLFQRIPESRTCDEAGIPAEFCSCGKLVETQPDDARAVQATHILTKLVKKVVSQNPQHTKCVEIDQFEIIKAQVRKPSEDLILQLKMTPYTALFGVTFRLSKFDKKTSDVRLLTLDRLDPYAPMTQCLENFTKNETMNGFLYRYATSYRIEYFCICKDVANKFFDKRRNS